MWNQFLSQQFQLEYFKKIQIELEKEVNLSPRHDLVFSIFKRSDFERVKVVIIGQDPYIKHGQATGVAFEVPNGMKNPPSLLNIKKELNYEFGYEINYEINRLDSWISQGVFPFNFYWTTKLGQSLAHQKLGWQHFSFNLIEYLNQKDFLIYLLWGNFAQSLEKYINPKHLILKASHPSPLSFYKSFYQSGIFKLCNQRLREHHLTEIDWEIKDVE